MGAWPILYEVFYVNFPTNAVESTAPFTVTVDPLCFGPTTFTASSLTDQEYTITDSIQKYKIKKFSVEPYWCYVSYTYTISDPTGDLVVDSFTNSTREFQFHYEGDFLPLGGPSVDFKDYLVEVTGTTAGNLP